MKHKTHLYLMGGLLFVGLLMFTGGSSLHGGGGLFLLVLLGACLAMLFFMVRLMGGMNGMNGTSAEQDARGHRSPDAADGVENGTSRDDSRRL